MKTEPKPLVNQDLVPAVGKAWAAIRKFHPEVPPVRLALGSRHRAGHKLAHFLASPSPKKIPSELLVSWEVEHNATGVRTMGIIVHEATHALAHERGIVDTSRGGRYHNTAFTELAAEMGLYLAGGRPAELGPDTLTVHAEKSYATAIKNLDAALKKSRRP